MPIINEYAVRTLFARMKNEPFIALRKVRKIVVIQAADLGFLCHKKNT
jgi:hypothetical protein